MRGRKGGYSVGFNSRSRTVANRMVEPIDGDIVDIGHHHPTVSIQAENVITWLQINALGLVGPIIPKSCVI